MKSPGDVYIAGSKTAADWKSFSAQLSTGHASWKAAFEDYFHQRLSLRYLEPIKVLQEHGTFRGEGFSIVAIQCSLIEFLESTVQGLSYRYPPRGAPAPGPHEYSSSSEIFVAFLTQRQPFAKYFNEGVARDFYEGVRCGLLHEARTKGGWAIHAKSSGESAIDATRKIVYRDNFQAALLSFVDWYKGALLTDEALQKAFIRKFNSLCR
jgi:hypothetical protein